ncbi:hypothetical protein EMPG_11345 [Blastomyces silverae]|uniref:Uncharacterized protein n=1 Tax=Blastomyces silverae TaxID=2060906 RepID=A0A0H1BRU5_9EURO|nr:hypothetical protein EMPG_11345 [Blastomyces silverae]
MINQFQATLHILYQSSYPSTELPHSYKLGTNFAITLRTASPPPDVLYSEWRNHRKPQWDKFSLLPLSVDALISKIDPLVLQIENRATLLPPLNHIDPLNRNTLSAAANVDNHHLMRWNVTAVVILNAVVVGREPVDTKLSPCLSLILLFSRLGVKLEWQLFGYLSISFRCGIAYGHAWLREMTY